MMSTASTSARNTSTPGQQLPAVHPAAQEPIPAELNGHIVRLRRYLHANPELDRHLPTTQAAVLDALEGTEGIELHTGKALSSVTAVLRGAAPLPDGTRRPVVLLRGDMDALPVTEETGLEYSPTETGKMHACGHDMHTAGLVGALLYLAQRRDELTADVVGMFQPAEETAGGAKIMIEEGLLEAAGQPVDEAYAIHVYADRYPHATFVSKPGTIQSGCDDLVITVHGQGGHGSAPHQAADPVPVAAEIVLGLQTMVTRQFDPFDPVVVTVGSIKAGSAPNIIPSTATIQVTLRSFSPASREKLVPAVQRVAKGIAEAHGMSASYRVECDFPVTVNSAEHVDYVAETVRDLFGDTAYRDLPRTEAGSEDFSEVLQRVPGAYIFLGAVPEGEDPTKVAGNHSPHAIFDDRVLGRSVRLFAELALRRGPLAQ
ncbi:M20 family metallopeptidase [Pseudoglutamicibacter albus]|uniref:M20 metallopeptidase family protein n=1 Tax=Pseudoglutamicibacter albus TaxID=98671 RepID=UPI001EF5B5BD|nr:M20 family metallopeptidase [Pseudoglutamicibacter albus]MCG7303750.1 M20 family metallopeptidase [Pseudoglutamicibacter albus]